ncbi:MAG: hypothetical protein V2B20_04215 [Pseudomonadota bacterium]
MQKNIFDALVQWGLVFAQPLSHIVIDESTPCTLHGVIVRQNLNVFLGEEASPHSLRNTAAPLLHEDSALVYDGIPCTLGELQHGQIKARLSLEFTPESQRMQPYKVLRDASWREIARTALIPWLISLQQQILEKKYDDGYMICLDGLVKKSGYIGERSLKYKVALAAARGVPIHEIPSSHVHQALVRELIDRKEYVRHGGTATVALYNEREEIVGSRTLTVD